MTLLSYAGVVEEPDVILSDEVKAFVRTTMERTALVFLHKPLARQLAVAWKVCGGRDAVWFDAAGVDDGERSAAKKLAIALRASGVCREGGVLDEVAERYIAALIAASLQRGQHGNKEKGGKRRRR